MEQDVEQIIAYAAKYGPVFPLEPGTKRPLYGWKWQTKYDHETGEVLSVGNTSADPDWIRDVWTKNPEALVGRPEVGYEITIDVDVKPGQMGMESLKSLVNKFPGLMDLLMETQSVTTASGGKHFRFLNTTGIELRPVKGSLPGVDLQVGDKSYCVCPPSITEKGAYIQSNDGPRQLFPMYLAEFFRDLQDKKREQQRQREANDDDDTIYVDGERNDALESHAGSLRARGMNEVQLYALLLLFNNTKCEPPLADETIRKMAHSYAQYPRGEVPLTYGQRVARMQDMHRAQATEEKPQSATAAAGGDDFNIVWQAEIVKRGVQPTDWDITGLIERNDGPMLLTAPPESYKSWYAMFLLTSIVTGTPFLHQEKFSVPKPRPHGFYINLDAGKKATENRFAMLSGGKALHNIGVMTWREWKPERFEALLKQYPGSFVVVDCLMDAYYAQAYMEPGEAMRKFLQPIKRVYEDYGCNGIFVDHTPRDNGIKKNPTEMFYGSQQKKATIRQGQTLMPMPANPFLAMEKKHQVKVASLKMSEAEKFDPFVIEFQVVNGFMTCKYICDSVEVTQEDLDKARITDWLAAHGPQKFGPIFTGTGIPDKRVRAALADTEMFSRTGGSYNTVYDLRDREDDISI